MSQVAYAGFVPSDYSIWEESSSGLTGDPLPTSYFTFTQSMAYAGMTAASILETNVWRNTSAATALTARAEQVGCLVLCWCAQPRAVLLCAASPCSVSPTFAVTMRHWFHLICTVNVLRWRPPLRARCGLKIVATTHVTFGQHRCRYCAQQSVDYGCRAHLLVPHLAAAVVYTCERVCLRRVWARSLTRAMIRPQPLRSIPDLHATVVECGVTSPPSMPT